MRVIAAVIAALHLGVAHHHHPLSASQFRTLIYRSDPCLANIIDLEDRSWDPTVNYGGGHGNVKESYGLGQADPGTKMASYGRDWRTNRWTQLRWMRAYAKKYGGDCAAWAFRRTHRYW